MNTNNPLQLTECQKQIKDVLDELFQRALAVMQPGQFKESVELRYAEFKAKCAGVRAGFTNSTAASST